MAPGYVAQQPDIFAADEAKALVTDTEPVIKLGEPFQMVDDLLEELAA